MRNKLLLSLLFNLIAILFALAIVYKLGGLSNVIYKVKSKHAIARMEHRSSQFESSIISNGAIIFLGDSITEHGEWSELFPNYTILNRGIAGDGIAGIRRRLKEISRHQPSLLFLMIGINDLCFLESSDVINEYRILIDELIAEIPSTKIVIQSILPINNSIYNFNTTNDGIDLVNASIAQICSDKSINYIDLASSLKDEENNLNPGFTSDGIHINGIAYNKWKAKLSDWFPIK